LNQPMKILHYNPVSKLWRASQADISGFQYAPVGSEYDPPSGMIVTIPGNGGLWIYDPVLEVKTKILDLPYATAQALGYNTNLVYFPPNQKMYLFSRDVPVRVWELTLNRSNWSASTFAEITGMTGDIPRGGGDPNTGYAYDSANQIIGGQVVNGKFFAYNPLTKQWNSAIMQTQPAGMSIGSQAFHALDYDPVNNVFFFLTGYNSGSHMWAYRYAGGSPSSSDIAPPTISLTAPASGATVSGTITVSATASDNVGVAGVQFKVDRANTGAEDLSAPYTSALNTLTLSNGSHTITATARDAAGNTATSASVSVSVSNSSLITGDADADFQARCSAPGVLKCVGFNSDSEIIPGLGAAWDGVLRGTLDTSVKASGAGSLRFEIPPFSPANTAGSWESSLGANFGPGTTFYVQFRQRFSPEMLTTNFRGGGWKQVIFHMKSKTCAAIELTTVNGYYKGFPQMYTDCGGRAFNVDLGNGDYLLQQGDYQCHYQNPTPSTCASYQSNQWMTFYYKVQLGNWGQPTSHIEAWVAFEGQPFKKFIDMPNYSLDYNSSPSDVYNYVTLLPYDTGKDPTVNHPTAYTWHDELIVSTQPIAAPGAQGLRGDLDGNGKVDLDDLRRMIYMLVGTVPKDLTTADLDGDGQLLLVDLQTLVRILVGIP